jgi:hypothetical protein
MMMIIILFKNIQLQLMIPLRILVIKRNRMQPSN